MRDNVVWLFAGTRGTGKTTAVKQVIRSSTIPKKLIVDTFDSDVWQTLEHHGFPDGMNIPIPIIDQKKIPYWKSGIYRLISSDTDLIFPIIEKHVKNALIVFEDATKYIGSRLDKPVRKFVLDSKQKNLDLIFIFHSLASIPPELVRVANYLTLFKTQEGMPSLHKYPFPQIPIAMKKIQKSSNRYHYETIRLS